MGRLGRELVVVFDVLMRERSLRRSAIRLGLTELDLRTALDQLHATLGEPLFTGLEDRLAPTTRAESLACTLRARGLTPVK